MKIGKNILIQFVKEYRVMIEYIGCSSAKDAKAKVISYWANSNKNVAYFGNPDEAEACFSHKTESRMFQLGALRGVEYMVKKGNKWI